jgi:hypothetical protein
VENAKKLGSIWPVIIVLIVALVYLGFRLSKYEMDPVGLAELGTKFSESDPEGTEGYDGQFAYYVAIEPNPSKVASQLDVPAYRYQRILYPLLARTIALGNTKWIPWTLILINIVSLIYATWMLVRYLVEINTPPRYALIFGLWAGVVVGIGTDLYEPLAFALVSAAWYARLTCRPRVGYFLLTLALLTKEVMIAFWLAALLSDLWEKRTRADWISILSPGAVFILWQVWLWSEFGSPGIVSGGAMATPFELLPFFGFIRIGTVSLRVLLLFSLFFGPTIIIPSIWGTVSSTRTLIKGEIDATTLALLINCLFIVFLPFSTFREPSGLLRVATGMIFAVLIYAGHHRKRRILNYGMFWIFMLAILIPQ